MIIQTLKYQTKLISKLIQNQFHFNFIILNNKLIFTHKINTKQIDLIIKLLNKHYLKYKIYKQ
jgi:hypothetical protein